MNCEKKISGAGRERETERERKKEDQTRRGSDTSKTKVLFCNFVYFSETLSSPEMARVNPDEISNPRCQHECGGPRDSWDICAL